jgi:hypothetical protein
MLATGARAGTLATRRVAQNVAQSRGPAMTARGVSKSSRANHATPPASAPAAS